MSIISAALAGAIRAHGRLAVVPDRQGGAYKTDASDDGRFGGDFRWLRTQAVKRGARPLMLRQLRHPAITHALECGCSIDSLRALTAHVDSKVMYRHYATRTFGLVADFAQRRGVVS